MARVLKGSRSFTCTPRVHPLTEWTRPALAFLAEAGTHLQSTDLRGMEAVAPEPWGTGGGARAPPLFQMAGHGGGTVEERLITIIYCNMPTINAKNQEWRNPLISIW